MLHLLRIWKRIYNMLFNINISQTNTSQGFCCYFFAVLTRNAQNGFYYVHFFNKADYDYHNCLIFNMTIPRDSTISTTPHLTSEAAYCTTTCLPFCENTVKNKMCSHKLIAVLMVEII